MKRARVVSTRRYTVDAAAKALELLGAFSFREPRLSLGDLVARTGIPRATAFRLLSTLDQSGFVMKVHGAYQLGIKCFVLGNIVANGLDVRETAHPHLIALRDATEETTQIAILDHWQVVYLERVVSPRPVAFMRSRAGAILPAYCTALGKTLLAHRQETDVAAWAAGQRFPSLTSHTITSAKRLMQELRAIRERGFSVDEQEREVGVRCVAAPVRNHTGEVIAAVSVAGPIDRVAPPHVDGAMLETVLRAARAISIDLGYTEHPTSVVTYRAARAAMGGRK